MSRYFGYVNQNTNGLNHGPVWKFQSSFLSEICTVILWQDCCGKGNFEKVLLENGWGKIPNWECLFVDRENGLFLSVYVDDIKMAGKKLNLDPMWTTFMKEVHLGEPTSFLDHVYLGCTQRECKMGKDVGDNYRDLFESRISSGGVEKLPYSEKTKQTCHLGPMTWKVMQRNVWKDIANFSIKQLSNYTKSQHHVG